MKTVIISDILSDSESIIPYGLRVGRAFETETDVLHIIDSRTSQGEYSQFSDSQSITPGSKFSPQEVLEREKSLAEKKMDEILSAEASRLNYPLKVNRVIVENTVKDEIIKRAANGKPNLFVISAQPDGTVFQSLGEAIDVLKTAGAVAIIVPSGKKFNDFNHIIIPVDFKADDISEFTDVKFIIEKFNPFVDIVSVTSGKDYLDMELEGETWTKIAKRLFLPTTVKTNILKGKDFAETVIHFIHRNQPSLIMLFRKKENPPGSIFKEDHALKIIKEVKVPLLVYFRK